MKIQTSQPAYKIQFCANPIKTAKAAINRVKNFGDSQSPFDNAFKIYDDLWEELALPKELKLDTKLRDYDEVPMAFEIGNTCIGINKNISNFKMYLMNRLGITKALFRHEIEHVNEWWLIIRQHKTENFVKKCSENNIEIVGDINRFTEYFKKVENILGGIKPEEKVTAEKYTNAAFNYILIPNNPNPSETFNMIIMLIKRRNNILERDANKAQKEYMPTKIEFIKAILKETWNILRNKKSN